MSPPLEPLRPGGYDFARDLYFQGIGATGFVLGAIKPAEPPSPPGLWLRYAASVQGFRDNLDTRIRSVLPGDKGSPLDTYGVQFGPPEAENIAVFACIKGTAKGRRYPVFGVGLNGVAGYRLQVSPAKKALELYKDQALKATVAYEWKSNDWLSLRLQIINAGGGT